MFSEITNPFPFTPFSPTSLNNNCGNNLGSPRFFQFLQSQNSFHNQNQNPNQNDQYAYKELAKIQNSHMEDIRKLHQNFYPNQQ
jgi:hypothetical protein